jgi:hypothetical protein
MLNFRELVVDATPTEVWTVLKYARCPLWIDETKGQWLGKFQGETLPTLSGKSPVPPTVLALEDEFPELRPFFEKKEKDYNLYQDPEFAKRLLERFSEIVSKKRNCIFLRPSARIAGCCQLMENMKSVNNHIKFDLLQYFGKLDKANFGDGKIIAFKTIKEVLNDKYAYKNNYAVVITSSGRSKFGDSFPGIVGNYFDFSDADFNWESLRQATIGRSCGFQKDSFVYLRKQIADQWRYYYENGCLDDRMNGKNASIRTEHYANSKDKRSRRCKTITFTLSKDWSKYTNVEI